MTTTTPISLRIQQVFNQQRLAFEQDSYPSVNHRIERLMRLRQVILDGQHTLLEAVCADFGHRSMAESRVAEIAGTCCEVDAKTQTLNINLVLTREQLRDLPASRRRGHHCSLELPREFVVGAFSLCAGCRQPRHGKDVRVVTSNNSSAERLTQPSV